MSMEERNRWWSSLRQNGMLLSPAVIDEFLPEHLLSLPTARYEQLRNSATAFRAWEQSAREGDATGLYRWLDVVLEDVLGYEGRRWQKHSSILEKFKVPASRRGGPGLTPDRVLLGLEPLDPAKFLVKIDRTSKRVGLGRGRQVYSAFLELLRGTNVPLGILTNGHQFRLIYAGIDYDCWTEWEADRWFEDEAGIEELCGFITLCGAYGTGEGKEYPLLSAVQESRTRQGELSQVLGEQTRRSVEVLLKALNLSLKQQPDLQNILTRNPGNGTEILEDDQNNALYQATIRLIMRLVVALFAEARGLLPKDSEIYYYSYSTEGLYTQLKQAAVSEGDAALEGLHQAWPRLLSLFRLIYEGSDLADLAIPAYGGGLFRRGDSMSPDAVLRALSLYEHEKVQIPDLVVYEILTLLKIGRVRARSGRTVRIVSGAVDFSDLRTEYIGMMYEGLLDYQLRKVRAEEEAVIFLNLGVQPVLPFSLLKSLPDSQIKDLLQKLGKEKAEKKVEGEGQEEEEEEIAESTEEQGEEVSEEEISEEPVEDADVVTEGEKVREILTWAVHAVEAANLVRRPRGRNPNLFQYQKDVERRAHSLIQPQSICYPGDLYLVRGTGTRKGSGTFYTKPQLAVPTVHRTLEPLVYTVEGEGEGRTLTPRIPEEILALKVCDPAMGSGSFLVAALRYITDALYESLWFHQRIRPRTTESSVITLPAGAVSQGAAMEEMLPCSTEDERFESLVKARLKRYVVERCIYGVDINPLAVELGKLSLWVETMDRELPFEFLDHKLKPGNSLVGCWFDNFQEYPVMAWLREGGDKGHKGVHFKEGNWTKAIKKVLDEKVKPELKNVIDGQVTLDRSISDEEALKALFEKAVRRFESIHAMAITDYESREAFFRDCILNDEGLRELKERFDLWCAIWFWPGEWMDEHVPTPERFYHPTPEIITRVQLLTNKLRFFHWELEFPDVFVAGKGGFDAVVGNPPWENIQQNPQEFFSKYNPIFRTLSRMDSLEWIKNSFKNNINIEKEWLNYNGSFKSFANWVLYSSNPFKNLISSKKYGPKWIVRLKKGKLFNRDNIPFILQKGRIFSYKLFLEFSLFVLQKKGRLGMIVPAGIYTDEWSKPLRETFLERCQWDWLFGFENRNKIFTIHSSFKFGVIVLGKSNSTKFIKCSFLNRDFNNWESLIPKFLIYSYESIYQFSPQNTSILEILTNLDLSILKKIYNNSFLFTEDSENCWNLKYELEFMMNSNADLFPPRDYWIDRGYIADQYGQWVSKFKPDDLVYHGKKIGRTGDIALPVYEGRMIGQFDFSEKGWVSGRGRTAKWNEISWEAKPIRPQFLMSKSCYRRHHHDIFLPKAVMIGILSGTNKRSAIFCPINRFPCTHVVPAYKEMNGDYNAILRLCAITNSFVFDYSLRMRLGGGVMYLCLHLIEEQPRPIKYNSNIMQIALQLSHPSIIFSDWWINHQLINKSLKKSIWCSLWAITSHERLRLRCLLDAIIAELYGLSYDDFAWILRECGYPKENIRELSKTFDPKGFWRVDKDKDPELRHTVLALKAFADLKEIGLDAFCALNHGEGWMIPETLTYKVNPDGKIVFDSADGKTVPVRERLGPRFLDWQLAGTPEESWKECEMHARNILGEEGFAKLMAEISSGGTYRREEERIGVAEKVLAKSGSMEGKSVVEVMKKAEEKKKEQERKEKGQRTLGEW